MNVHLSVFGKLSDEQQALVKRGLAIREEEHELYNELQHISRMLGYQGINLWEEMREYQKRLQAIEPTAQAQTDKEVSHDPT